MESSNIEEQTPEEKLVDELVGIRMQIEGKVKEDAPLNKQREIKSVVKKVWANGASYEEIQNTYYKNVRKSIDSEKVNDDQPEFSKKLFDLRTKTKKEFKKLNFNFIDTDHIKNNVMSRWKSRTRSEDIEEDQNNHFNKTLNKKFIKLEKNKYKTPEFQSFNDFEEEEKYEQEDIKEKLVNKLVGLGSSFGEELNSLDIQHIYKLAIKSTVQKVWKEGASLDEIQKTYDELANRHLNDKKELEKQKLLNRELEELKKESVIQEELENEKLKFEGYIQEIKKDFQDNKDKEFHCTTILENNTLFIEKKKPISKNFCGENKILYLDILSAVYEKENPRYEYIQVYTEGLLFKLVNKNKEKNLKDFYNKLMEKINKEKICHVKNIKKDDNSSCSDADELMKWYELREKGVITQEEFESKKNKLI